MGPATGVEPASPPWEGGVLPLDDADIMPLITLRRPGSAGVVIHRWPCAKGLGEDGIWREISALTVLTWSGKDLRIRHLRRKRPEPQSCARMESGVGFEPHAGLVLAPAASCPPISSTSGCAIKKERNTRAHACSFCSWLSSSRWMI